MSPRLKYHCLILLALSFGIAPAALAQRPGITANQIKGQVTHTEPCCAIAAYDGRTGIVTGRETATGRTFQFIATPAQRGTLRQGQQLWADFATQKVSVDAGAPCCAMVNLSPGAAVTEQVRASAKPTEPCCTVSAINRVTGVVTAKKTATGRVFQFRVADPALLGTLTPGQKVGADFSSGMVRVHGGEPCCTIVSATPAR